MGTHLRIVILAALAILPGCGVIVSGGSGDPDSHPPVASLLGERAVPGYAVQAFLMDRSDDGMTSVRLWIVADAGQSAPVSVAGWIGDDFDPAAVAYMALPVPGMSDGFDVRLSAPLPLATGTVVWVRMTLADGGVIEVGKAAFPL